MKKVIFVFSSFLLAAFLVLVPSVKAQFGEGIQSPFTDNAYTDVEQLTANKEAPLTTMELIISNVLGLLTVLGSILFIASFLLGAIGWITAGGEANKVNKARDQMLHGVIGLFILVMIYALVGLVGSILGINQILSPAAALKELIPS